MGRKRNCPRSHCPINFALEVLGDAWTLLVLRDAILLGKRRFKEFLESDEKIATNILADRLARLTKAKILRKEEGSGAAAYGPTEKGLDLIPLMLELSLWGARYDKDTAAPPEVIAKLRKDRAGFAAAVRERALRGETSVPLPEPKRRNRRG